MNEENNTYLSYINEGPLGEAYDSADYFVAGMVYYVMINNVVKEYGMDSDTPKKLDATSEIILSAAIQQLADHFGHEC
jgi:hypothetical protein